MQILKIVNLLEYISIFNYAATIIRSHKRGKIFKVYFFFSGEKGLDNSIQNTY